MRLSFWKSLWCATLLQLTTSSIYQPEANSSNTIVIYWGQDSAGNYIEKNLAYYCDLGNNYDVIIMSFMISFIDSRQPNCGIPNGPDLNFANHGNNCSTFTNCPFLLNCTSSIGPDIEHCQANGKKIMLSLGGAVGSYGFTSDTQATDFATTIWDMFFGGSNSAGIRPFGNTVLDGIDLDIEGGSSVGYGAFFQKLKDLMNADNSKAYILSGAPQCVYPDAYLGPGSNKALSEAAQDFTWINVQFYNNYCGIFSESQFMAAYKQWDEAANSGGYKINVGIPAANGAGGGYVSPSTACGYVPQLRQYESFNGFMLWDTSWDNTDQFAMSEALRKCL